MALETKSPPNIVYRLARGNDAWQFPDWSRASPSGGTFGNRFDDPESQYRVIYASTQEVSCFIETLAWFRPDLTLIAELKEIEGDDDFAPIGAIAPDWSKNRVLGTAQAEGNYADICGAEWITYLRRKLASDCLRLGIDEFDASVLQRGSPRQITQLSSRTVYELGYPGIYYRSRYGHDFENWALFEGRLRIRDVTSRPIADDYPALLMAANILGLEVTQ